MSPLVSRVTERPDLAGYLQNDSITFYTAWDGAHCTCIRTPAKFSRKLANHFAPRSLRLAAFPIARILVVANSMDITAISLGRRSPSTANRAASSRQLRRHKLRLSAVQRHRRSRFDWPLREPWLHSPR